MWTVVPRMTLYPATMLLSSLTRPLFAASLALAFVCLGCPKNKDGCTTDQDCKGARVCVSGVCSDPGKTPAASATTAAATDPEPAPVAPLHAQGGTDLPSREATPSLGGRSMVVNPPANHQRAVVRASPSLDAATVATLERGTTVTSSEVSGDGQFHKITWTAGGGGSGWIHRDVVGEPGAAPKAAKAVPLGGCSRDGQWCLLNGTTAGVCMTFGSLSCATPTTITHHDGCQKRRQACKCGAASGSCDIGTKKEGLYCQCAAAKAPVPVNDPRCGCKVDGVIYERSGAVYGCEGGGNWCASSPRLAGGCPRRPGC